MDAVNLIRVSATNKQTCAGEFESAFTVHRCRGMDLNATSLLVFLCLLAAAFLKGATGLG